MDCRNYYKEKCYCMEGYELEKVFQLQESLLEKYLDIEKLPKWPININNRQSQRIIKDMSARVIEELGEGYESTTLVLQMLTELGYNLDYPYGNKWSNDKYRQLLNHLQNSNEEQVDALAFFINILLYSNIGVDDIKEYVVYSGLNKTEYLDIPKEQISTSYLMIVGLDILQDRFSDSKECKRHTWKIISENIFECYSLTYDDYLKVTSYTPAFHSISWDFHEVEAKMCWEISYHLSVARNYLKNKSWKQTDEITDEKRFQEEIVIAFLELLGYFKYIGFNADTLLQLRYKKHLVNEFRINSNY